MSFASLIHHYAYAGLAVGVLLEGETAAALGGMAARTGYLSLPWVIAVATAGALVADALAYGVRIAAAMALGMSGMSWLRFAGLGFIGACFWAMLVACGGYLAGSAVLAML
jgi:membrane protein DedA with SNARE-associated domain